MSRLPELRRDQLSPDAQTVWDAIVGTRGSQLLTAEGGLAGPFNAFVHAPDVGRGLTDLGATLRFGTSIERRLSEVAIITVGARWQAEVEWTVHAVASQLAQTGHVAADAYDAARDLLGDTGIVELVALCGYYTLISFLLNAFGGARPPGAGGLWLPATPKENNISTLGPRKR